MLQGLRMQLQVKKHNSQIEYWLEMQSKYI